jgi:hypothetical protein
MLPVIASMVMGGLFKQSTNQMPAAGAAGAGNNPLAEIIEQMMKQGGLGGMLGGGMPGGQPSPQQQAPQSQNPFDPMGNNPFGKVLQDMFGGGARQQPTQAPAGADPSSNPWGKILEDMLGGGQQAGGQEESQPQQAPTQKAPTRGGRSQNPYDDIFGKMFETGRQQRDDYQKGMESIFDQFKKGMGRS